MKIRKTVLAISLAAGTMVAMTAQSQNSLTNQFLIDSNQAALKAQSINPSLTASNATPTIGRQGFTPAMPNPGIPAIIQTQGFTTGIGQQGSTAIGQQGSGTAIGQQGSTAIGQQGVGTAIQPSTAAISPSTNAIVIGQPEPFTPAPAIAPPPTGFTSNLLNRSGRFTNSLNPRLTNAPMTPVLPSPVMPSTRTVAPPPARRR
jgi:hypothetical protein